MALLTKCPIPRCFLSKIGPHICALLPNIYKGSMCTKKWVRYCYWQNIKLSHNGQKMKKMKIPNKYEKNVVP